MSGVPLPVRRAGPLLSFIILATLLGSLVVVPAAGAHDTSGLFVTRSGSQLMLAGQPYTFTGINLYNANSDGWCRDALSDAQVGAALDDAGLGGEVHGVLRAWFFQTLATDKTTRTRDWTRFDRTLAIAKARGYKVIATLTDQWGECGTDVTPTYGYKTQDWYTTGYTNPDPGMVSGGYGPGWLSYRDWVAQVVARYKDEPAVLAWQLVNEAEVNPGGAFGTCPPGDGPRDVLKAWASDVSGLVRSIDTNHLISLGTIGGGQCGSQGSQYQDVHDLPNIDLCEVHDYTPNQANYGDPWNGFGVRVQQCAALNKPLIVGETGIIPDSVGGTLEDRALSMRAKRLAQLAAGVAGIVAWDFAPGGSTLDNYDIGPGDPMLAELASPGPSFVVNTTDDHDDGACSVADCTLREAIQAANAQSGPDLIAFSIAGTGVHTIAPTSALPAITDEALLDGTTQPGTAGSPLIAIDGSAAGSGTDGLAISGPDITVRGIEVTGFGGSGIVATGAGDRIEANRIHANGHNGVTVLSPATYTTVTANAIFANGALGIDVGDDGPNLNVVGGPIGFPPPSIPPSDFHQNHPDLSSADPGTDLVSGNLAAPVGTYRIELYKLASCDDSYTGEGDQLVATTSIAVTVPGGNFGTTSFALSPGDIHTGDWFAATATNELGTTSEFSNCATTPIADLSVGLDAAPGSVGAGEPIHYTSTVVNGGTAPATNVVLQQVLPSGATFIAASATGGTCSQAGGTVTCALGTVSASGGIATITVDVLSGAPGAASSSVSVSTTDPEFDTTNNTASASTTVLAPTPTTFVVNATDNVNDGACNAAHCSLLEAITAANANPGRDTIVFNLTGSRLIQPSGGGLPVVTGPVVIDGTTNPGYAGQPIVELSGANAFGAYGLRLAGGSSEVRGLILNRWTNPAIQLETVGGDVVAGNWFGVDETGAVRAPNANAAISVQTWNNRIGGSTAADRNIISGGSSGIRIGRPSATAPRPHDNVVTGNYVGLNAAGTAAIANTTGIVISDGNDNIIGGTGPGQGNVIAGSTQDGILVSDSGTGQSSERNTIVGNLVGVNASGTTALPNQTGVRVAGNAIDTTIGGTTAAAANTIAGNAFDGIEVFNGPTRTTVVGNRIGTMPDGTTAMPNGRYGVHVSYLAPGTAIGGTTAGTGNVIAFNAAAGVFLDNVGAAVTGNRILSNGGLGIDRSPTGVTATPAGQAFPVLSAAVTQNGLTTVAGTLAVAPLATYRVELFGNTACDASGYGEGAAFLAATSVTTDGSGNASFSVPLPASLADGTAVTATSTSGASGQTSEFSACRSSGPPPTDTASGSGAKGSTTTTDTDANGATPIDPIETSVTVPPAVVTPGPIAITEQAVSGTPPVNYGFFGLQVQITAPIASAASPLVLQFVLDASAIPSGQDATSIVVFRNGVPVPACSATDGSATPDPCVSQRETLTSAPYNGDIRLTVLTSQASTWNTGIWLGPPPFSFSGFFEPVNNPPVINGVNAGRAVPVKFSLGGDQGLAIFATGSPASQKVTCDTSAPLDTIEQTLTAGTSSLTYDATTATYTYVWKTDKSWKGTCRKLTLTLTDGSVHIASFRFE